MAGVFRHPPPYLQPSSNNPALLAAGPVVVQMAVAVGQAEAAAVTRNIGKILAFARPSVGTYFDATGTLKTAQPNVARNNYTFDGSVWVSAGVLIEAAATNYLLQSNTFTDNNWHPTAVGGSVTGSAGTSPDGTLNASVFVENTAAGEHLIYQNPSSDTTTTATVYAKYNGRFIVLRRDYGTTEFAVFNLQTGAITSVTNTTATITNVGSGWYRCSINGPGNGSFVLKTSTTATITTPLGGGEADHTGDGASGFYLFGAQIESGLSATSTIITTTSALTRAADNNSGAAAAQAAARLRNIAAIRSATLAQIAFRLVSMSSRRLVQQAQALGMTRAAGVIRSSLIAAAVNLIVRKARLISLTVVSVQLSALLRQIAHPLAATGAQSAALTRAIGHTLSVTNAQAVLLQRLPGVIRAALAPESVALRLGMSWTRSATASQTVSRTLAIGWLRSTAAAQTTVLAAIVAHARTFAVAWGSAAAVQSSMIRVKAMAAIDAEVTALTRAAARTLNATGAQTAARVVMAGILRSTTTVQTAARSAAQFYLRSLAAVSGQAPRLQRLTAILRAALLAQTAARVAALSIIRPAVTSQATALQRLTAAPRTVAGTQIAAVLRGIGIARAVANAQSAARAGSIIRSAILAAVSAQVAVLVALFIHAGVNTGKAVAAVSAETVALVRAMGRALPVLPLAQSQTIALIRQPARLLSSAAASAVALLKATGLVRAAGSPQTVLRAATVSKWLPLISPETVVATAMRSFGRAIGAGNTEVAGLVKFSGRALAVIAVSAFGLIRQTSVARGSTALQATGRNAAISHILAIAQSSGTTMGSAALRGRAFAVQQAQVLSQTAQRIIGLGIPQIVGAISGNAAAIGRGLNRTFGVVTAGNATVLSWYQRFIPLALRRRVVRLPPPRTTSTLPRAIRRVLLPPPRQTAILPRSVRRIVLPREEDEMSDYQIHDPEPAAFTPFDPADQETFTFDWSVRGYAGDNIVFASVVSIPAGIQFVGPAFISGAAVSITVGPFVPAPTVLPQAYSLRCMAIFASGRISNYSIPMQVMAL